MIPGAATDAGGSEAGGPMPDGPSLLWRAISELARAIQALAALGGGPAPAEGRLDEATRVWSDREYTYIESRLPRDVAPCVDITTCGRRLVIRIARPEQGRL
jgi:hypothetical protein